MQNAPAGDAPVLIRIETRTGHGQSRPTTKQIELAADQRDASYCASRW
jgi:prolyl oligopeptidase